MTRFINRFLILMLALPLVACMSGGESSGPPLQTITSLDVPRYLGTWYEITKYPNRFQEKCVSDTSANYTAEPDGRLKVVNRCKMANGEFAEAVGDAYQGGGSTSPKLKVRFAPSWLSFLPMVWGNYWVIDIDKNYQLAAVSEPTRQYLWILSRTPTIDSPTYEAILARLKAAGFDLTRLEKPAEPH